MRPMRRHVLPVLALAAFLTGAAPAMGASGTRVWMTTGRPAEPADAAVRRVDRRARGGRPDDHRRPDPDVPDDGRVRRVDHRLRPRPLAPRPAAPWASATRSCSPASTSTPTAVGLSRLAPAHRRLGLHRRAAPHLQLGLLGGGDRPRANPVFMHRPRRGADPAAAAPGTRAQPGPEGDRLTVRSRFFADEAEQLDHQRPAARRSALPTSGSTRCYLLEVRAGARGRWRAGRRRPPPHEPQNRTPDNYVDPHAGRAPGRGHQRSSARCSRDAGSATKIIVSDQTGPLHPNDVGAGRRAPNPDYARTAARRPAARAAGSPGPRTTATAGDPSAQSELHDAFPDKDIYFTECSGIESQPTRPTTFSGHAAAGTRRILTIGSTRNWARRRVINWNLALDPEGGPHNGGCDTCTGVVTIDPDRHGDPRGRLLRARPRDEVRQARRGADRLDRRRARIWTPSRFRNPDGSTVVLVSQRRLGHRLAALQPHAGADVAVLRPAGGGGRHVERIDDAEEVAARGRSSTATRFGGGRAAARTSAAGAAAARRR